VLSAFMVADTVEIMTCHPTEERARQISLRSVHGRYLIRFLDKNTDPTVRQVTPHGTLFKLKLRASAKQVDVLQARSALGRVSEMQSHRDSKWWSTCFCGFRFTESRS
jgi:HSP90 family molecular chaperone